MFELTREVRLGINPKAATLAPSDARNGFGASPPLIGLAHYFAVRVTLAGTLDPQSHYLRNIKDIDAQVRERGLPLLAKFLADNSAGAAAQLPAALADVLLPAWPGLLKEVCLMLSPQTSLACLISEKPMVRLSHKFEFCASHRLHNPALSDEDNRKTYGKCNNPQGHGHNYDLEVTIAGLPDPGGVLIGLPLLEQVVLDTVIEPMDHKNLNTEVAAFAEVIPSCENISRVIYHLLKPKIAALQATLASVTVWETSRTWCRYEE